MLVEAFCSGHAVLGINPELAGAAGDEDPKALGKLIKVHLALRASLGPGPRSRRRRRALNRKPRVPRFLRRAVLGGFWGLRRVEKCRSETRTHSASFLAPVGMV